MKRKKPAAPALAGAAGFFQGGTQKYTAAVGRNPRGRRALWGYKAIGLHQHRGTAGDAALQPCHPGCPEGPCHDIATGWVIFLPAGRLRCLPCQQPCYGPKTGIVPRPLVLDRGNSDFQVRGSAAGGVILLASDTAAQLKTPQAPASVTGWGLARLQGGGWLTPARPENAASARLRPRLGAVSFVH